MSMMMTNDGCTKGQFKMISVNDISCHTTQINKREAQQLHQKRTCSPKSDDDNQKATKKEWRQWKQHQRVKERVNQNRAHKENPSPPKSDDNENYEVPTTKEWQMKTRTAHTKWWCQIYSPSTDKCLYISAKCFNINILLVCEYNILKQIYTIIRT